MGGERNWDYRYCWLRDAAMTLEALLEYGYRDEATGWRNWLLRAVAGRPADLQIMYGVDGRRDLLERELDHLPGYGGSRPVRIGNGAVDQVQNDVLGEVMCALDLARSAGIKDVSPSWELQRTMVEDLTGRWRHPDRGIWEVRGDLQHFTHSKVMAWAALDRAVRAVEEYGLDGPVEHWRAERDLIHEDVLAPRLRRRAQHVRAGVRRDQHRRGAPADGAGGLPAARRPPLRGHGRRDPRRARGRATGSSTATTRRRPTTASPAESTRSSRAASGSRTRSRGWATRTSPDGCSTG